MELAAVFDKEAAAAPLFQQFKQTLRHKTHTTQTYKTFNNFHFDFRLFLQNALLFKVRPSITSHELRSFIYWQMRDVPDPVPNLTSMDLNHDVTHDLHVQHTRGRPATFEELLEFYISRSSDIGPDRVSDLKKVVQVKLDKLNNARQWLHQQDLLNDSGTACIRCATRHRLLPCM